jgi:hypothetical protein
VVHIDRIYLPGVLVATVDLVAEGGVVELMRDGEYVVDFE